MHDVDDAHIKAEIDQKVKPLEIPVKKPIKVKKEDEDTGEYFEEVEPEFVDIDKKIQEEEESTMAKGDGFFIEESEEKPPADEHEFEIVFKDIPSIDKKIAKLLIQNGIDSVESLKTTTKDLTRIRGIKKKIAKQIKKEVEIDVKDIKEEDFESTTFESVDEHLFEETTEEWESFDEKKIGESVKKEIEGFMHGDYTLYEKVIETKDGLEALQFLKQQIPDIIILDLYMEKISVFKVLTILKSSPNWKNIPVIVFSARDTQAVRKSVIEAGADEYLSKRQLSQKKLFKTAKQLLT